MSEPEEAPVTADGLTQTLRADGALPDGAVEAVRSIITKLSSTPVFEVTASTPSATITGSPS